MAGRGATSPDGLASPASLLPDPPTWWRCDRSDATVECATLEVPLDHEDPEGEAIRLPVERIRALDPERRIGTLVTIAGGPGQRGTLGVRPGTHAGAIAERFDIVSWDPRGTSGETLIDCIPEWDPFVGLDRTPDTPSERTELDERISALASRCSASHGEVLPHLGTLQTVLDLERLREMLGEMQVSLLGMSYGSEVALRYASLFPDRVRAVVLDGYSDPNRSPAEREVEQAMAFEIALDGLLAACAADDGCPFHHDGRPGVALDQLLEQLDVAPLPAGEGRVLTQSDTYEAIAGSLIRDDAARQRLLAALAATDHVDGAPLLEIAIGVRHAYESSGLTQGVFMAVYCADTVVYWRGLTRDKVAALTDRIHRVAPRLGPWLWSPPADADLPPAGLCAMQPDTPPTLPGPFDATGAGTILVLASTGDPTTPISAARRATRDIADATLVTLAAEHHLAYPYAVAAPQRPAHRCLLDAVEAYLIDLAIPANGSACTDG